jgi:hypothetical protein
MMIDLYRALLFEKSFFQTLDCSLKQF